MSNSVTPTIEYAESFIAYFSNFSVENDWFVPELETATRVVALMRRSDLSNDDRFAMISAEMRAIESVRHYDGSGWHGFKNVVRWWLEDQGYHVQF